VIAIGQVKEGNSFHCQGLISENFGSSTVGENPRRWASVHKELKSKLRGKLFTGNPEVATKGDGRKYTKIKNLSLVKRKGNNTGTTLGTILRQIRDNRIQQGNMCRPCQQRDS